MAQCSLQCSAAQPWGNAQHCVPAPHAPPERPQRHAAAASLVSHHSPTEQTVPPHDTPAEPSAADASFTLDASIGRDASSMRDASGGHWVVPQTHCPATHAQALQPLLGGSPTHAASRSPASVMVASSGPESEDSAAASPPSTTPFVVLAEDEAVPQPSGANATKSRVDARAATLAERPRLDESTRCERPPLCRSESNTTLMSHLSIGEPGRRKPVRSRSPSQSDR